jgi:hypothetical protein
VTNQTGRTRLEVGVVDTSVHLLGAIRRVLSSDSTLKIDFQIGVQRINGDGFLAVANALYLRTQSAGQGIGVQVMSTPGAAGQYNPTTNDFELPFWHPVGDDDNMTIVHEAVHAMQDARFGLDKKGGTSITRSETEAAAFLAEGLYYYYETGKYYEETAITTVAAAIVKKLKDKQGSIVTSWDATVLRKIVASDPLYGGSLYADNWADGVPGV